MKIGFIGIGNMGGPMARNLIAAGHQGAVFDLSLDAIAALVDAGATAAGSPIDRSMFLLNCSKILCSSVSFPVQRF